MNNRIADDFFDDLVKSVVNETMNALFTDEFFPTMVDMFDVDTMREQITPIVMHSIDDKYENQMKEVKDGRL